MRGPAFTFTRVFSRSSILLAASDMFVSDARLSSSPPTCAVNTRSPSIDDLELMRELEAGHVADDVAQQEDAELVLGVLREVVPEEQAAARAERQPLDVILLRVVRRNAVAERGRRRCRCRRPGC